MTDLNNSKAESKKAASKVQAGTRRGEYYQVGVEKLEKGNYPNMISANFEIAGFSNSIAKLKKPAS